MDQTFVWPHRVRFVDTDASGRIHYTSMLRFFEAAEVEFFRSVGVSYSEFENEVTGYPRVYVDCNYTGSVVDDDLVRIAVSVEHVGKSSFTLGFAATVRGGAVAHGKIVIVCMDKATQRSQPLPEAFAALLRRHCRPGAG